VDSGHVSAFGRVGRDAAFPTHVCVCCLRIGAKRLGGSPLYLASFEGNVELMRTLLFAGAAVNFAGVRTFRQRKGMERAGSL
jgi:hypothetical protein